MEPTYNLATNLPVFGQVPSRLREALANEPLDADVLSYPDPAGPLWIRASIARWLERMCGHRSVDPALLTLTLGAREAIHHALFAATEIRNPALLVEEHTYQGVRQIAQSLGIRCVDVAMDQYGMRPDALMDAAKRSRASAVYVQPTLQNPTTATMSFERRMEIADVAEAFGLAIIEGDVYSPLASSPADALPPFASIVPGLTFHAGGIGKILGPGLRVGWLLSPGESRQSLSVQSLQLEHDGLPTLWPSVVARWMDNGSARDRVRDLVDAMARRNALARGILGPDLVTAAAGLHAWLPVTDAPALEKRLLARGVHVVPSRQFVGQRKRARGIRVALGAEQDMNRLDDALRIVAGER